MKEIRLSSPDSIDAWAFQAEYGMAHGFIASMISDQL